MLGFKSFCERTHITFGGAGVTCIVGPNGCGKSNIVDAVSWVLGEQSHKSLRAERMADCIFNGTAKRPPTGMAEVSLTLIDPELAEAAKRVLEGTPEPEESEKVERSFEAGAAEFNAETAVSIEVTERQPEAKLAPRQRSAQTPAPHTKPGEV